MKDERAMLFVLFLGIAFGAVAGWAITKDCTNFNWKREAVKHGKAEYYLDSNNERQWRWK